VIWLSTAVNAVVYAVVVLRLRWIGLEEED